MPVNLTFYRIDEKKPKDGEDVIWLRPEKTPYGVVYKIDCDTAEYFKNLNGEQNHVLFLNSQKAEDSFLWINFDEYLKIMRENYG